jgi:DNA-binding CsgD family transcriptional regulator
MSQQENRIADSQFSQWVESGAPAGNDLEAARLSAAHARGMEEAGAAIARQLNGPLTALLLYISEIKRHSDQLSQGSGNRAYLQQVVENALQQTERVCAMTKQSDSKRDDPVRSYGGKSGWETRAWLGKEGIRAPGAMFSSSAGQKPLTKREREVLTLISEGYSNKLGALRMNISPRTFESHRAEAMRKLGARNTADLVRTALLHPGAV